MTGPDVAWYIALAACLFAMWALTAIEGQKAESRKQKAEI